MTYLGMYALQHRGQESCGIVASDGSELRVEKAMGHVSEAFDQARVDPLRQEHRPGLDAPDLAEPRFHRTSGDDASVIVVGEEKCETRRECTRLAEATLREPITVSSSPVSR